MPPTTTGTSPDAELAHLAEHLLHQRHVRAGEDRERRRFGRLHRGWRCGPARASCRSRQRRESEPARADGAEGAVLCAGRMEGEVTAARRAGRNRHGSALPDPARRSPALVRDRSPMAQVTAGQPGGASTSGRSPRRSRGCARSPAAGGPFQIEGDARVRMCQISLKRAVEHRDGDTGGRAGMPASGTASSSPAMARSRLRSRSARRPDRSAAAARAACGGRDEQIEHPDQQEHGNERSPPAAAARSIMAATPGPSAWSRRIRHR